MHYEERVRLQKDELALDPELIPYSVAGYLAQEIALKMEDMYEVVAKAFEEDSDIKSGHLTTPQVIGALQLLACALAREMVQESPDPVQTIQFLMNQNHNYMTMVPDIQEHLKRMRSA
jgi:hypothetical protein